MMMKIIPRVWHFFAAIAALLHLVSADCSIFDPSDKANAGVAWNNERTAMRYDHVMNYYYLDKSYGGITYHFQFYGGQSGADSLSCWTDNDNGWKQFRIIVKNKGESELRSYWASDGAQCNHEAPYREDEIGQIVVVDRVKSKHPLPPFNAGTCSLYDPKSWANENNRWYQEHLIPWDDKRKLHYWESKFHGVLYRFNFIVSTNGKDYMGCPWTGKTGGPQFKVKVKDHQGHVLRSYWLGQGVQCTHDTPIRHNQVGSIWISERCYKSCPPWLESP